MDKLFFSIKTKTPQIVKEIMAKGAEIEIDGLNVLKEKLTIGQLVFIVLGGDKGQKWVTWQTGLIGIGAVSATPYDEGYDPKKIKNYKIKVDMKVLFDTPIKREALVPYKDTYGIIGISPITTWEPNQAISQVEAKKAIALMRAMLDINPDIESDLKDTIGDAYFDSVQNYIIDVASMTAAEREADFKNWISQQTSKRKGKRLEGYLIKKYITKLRYFGKFFERIDFDSTNVKPNLFEYGDLASYFEVIKLVEAAPNFKDVNDETSRELKATLGWYGKYLSFAANETDAADDADDADVPDGLDEETAEATDEYTAEQFLKEVFVSESEYNTLKGLLLNKKNIILQGAPGVGKTFIAKRLAYSILGAKDVDKVDTVQFHQSTSYEDFIIGYRPTSTGGFELKPGPFYKFCKKAEANPGEKYFFIIDEINRGNLSKIFGELLMLIEGDKRAKFIGGEIDKSNAINLVYSDYPYNESFAVPENVYLIGMMNTADRSLAVIDYALRRRFSFYEMMPKFESDGFKAMQVGIANTKFDALVKKVIALNSEIEKDAALGKGFCIGHSYFCPNEGVTVDDAWLKGVVDYELIPLISEYWFDERTKVKHWEDALRAAL